MNENNIFEQLNNEVENDAIEYQKQMLEQIEIKIKNAPSPTELWKSFTEDELEFIEMMDKKETENAKQIKKDIANKKWPFAISENEMRKASDELKNSNK